ncbi:PREDICTED: putative mediator of RNA polymerase II transcription subunit 26 isoform X2 [Acromyrmex echinatior]|uniref:putative mediator of RNA polymerase II transcription subunit 26 isoform X2 n=1 Tax=Acromyrmex echinatior TaxID=103372 RepID=UPI000580FAEA|nr:PREDICTED: putative mediator of RNA polymerase II transcription subunit 26 isoform X2 [Acromyrmex echinatior]
MEALLPSEIARLVLGYLEDQKCTEAAKLFLETSPHLQECRTVLSCGRRFSTRVNGLTLMDIIEKLSAISAMIQERLSKATDCEQLKHCGDLIEQLKFLVEEPRGQRFVVNINVPSQSNTQTSSGSPIVASNLRKRHHSNSERIKRNIKSQLNLVQQSEIISPPSCHNIDTTPLESLPGNVDLLKQIDYATHTEKRDDNFTQELHRQCDSDKHNSTNSIATHNRNNSTRISLDDVSSVRSCEMDIDDKKKEENNVISTIPKQYTAATSTEELLSFSSTEVQTIPYEIPESESESNDVPIENLSILTKEMLNREELQQCIAENINRAIIPTDLSLKDDLNESMIGEGNTSFMAEINNAIKSIVETTESDPVFKRFIAETIGVHTETDTSPEEEGEGKLSQKSTNEIQKNQMETDKDNINLTEPVVMNTKVITEDDTTDVPLKHRLRSSSRQQYNRVEDEVDKVKDQEKDRNTLEDQNAAAVLSIINANIINSVSDSDKKTLDAKELITVNDDNEQKIQTMTSIVNKNDAVKPLAEIDIQKTNDVTLSANSNVQPKVKKSTLKRLRPTKLKRDQATSDNQFNSVQANTIQPITEHEIMTMPTLIVCSKDEMDNLLINRSSTITSTSTSRFIPIAPKDPSKINETVETLYLRTVNVAQQLPVTKTLSSIIEEPNNPGNQVELLQSKNGNNVNKRLKTIHQTDMTVPTINIDQQVLNCPIEPVQINKIIGGESITLYANETSAKTSLDGTNMPMINLEENISLSDSGFSPYLKFNCSKINQTHNLSDIDLAPVMENVGNSINSRNEQLPKNIDIITKRTPKSLLKSRSKNHRLSLSTPRKRSSHIRALDFSTPTRTTRKTNGDGNSQFSTSTKRLKSVCRTSLFRSPALSNTSAQKQKSPIKVSQSYRIPIATRSPAPKLMGGWDKYNGVGVIIGEVSPHGSTSASCSSSEDRIVQHKPSKSLAGNWDADLRKNIEANKKDEKDESDIKSAKRKKNSIKDNEIHKKAKYSSRSSKSNDERKTDSKSKMNRKFKYDVEDIDELEENSQENIKIIESQNNEKENKKKAAVNTVDFTTNKFNKISTITCETSAKTNNTNASSNDAAVSEKKPVKKYAQLKTISTNLRKFDNEKAKNMEVAQINLQVSEVSRILSVDSTQHILRMPDMINLETPRKFDNISGPPPTPRVLSPSSSLITPFIKISEDSSKIRSFIPTPEFPITPGIAITPKEEITRDVIKRGEYNSPYYKPTSEQAQESDLKVSNNKPKDNSTQESPIISSSHIQLHSVHNSLTSGNTYQTCSSKLEITEFEVIKENLPKEEAIKEFKIASSSKDSGSAEFNASIVTDRHIDLIQINEFKGISKHQEIITDVNDPHNDSENSSSSDTSSSSSSSSSSTSSSSNTSINTCSPNEKCDKAPSKTSTDISSDFAEKNINAPKNINDATNIQNACKKSDNAMIETESSPKKIFAITKTDDQLKNTQKETPAKDETLLNEANISETPSSSKSGVEMINLTTKISAIMTKDEKLSKSNKPPKNNSKIQINKPRPLPKIIDIQCIQPGLIQLRKSIEDECQSEGEQSTSVNNKFVQRQLLEEKRQRIMAKIKDNSKLNPCGTKRKRISTNKASETLKKFGRGNRNIRPTIKYSRNVNKNTEPQDNRQETSRKNTQRQHEPEKPNLMNKRCDNKEKTMNQVAASKSTDSNLTNYKNNGSKPLDNHTTKQFVNDICENNEVENCKKNEFTELHNSLSENQDYLKKRLDTKESIEEYCNIESNIDKDGIREIQKNIDVQEQILKKENSEKYIVKQEISALDKVKHDQIEDKKNKPRQFLNDKSDYKILRYKVDQVKRDLFSDEENDNKTSSAKDNETETIDTEIQNSNLVEASDKKKIANVENPKQELSTVLQCLQLVPASKKEHLHNNKSQAEQQHKEQSEFENESDNELHQIIDVHKNKTEYHFVYDDSVPMKKRRRRYSAHELQIEINYADLSDPNPVECIKIMKATEFEEILNLPPKKRTVNKKSRTKNEKVCETPKTDKDMLNLKDDTTKPLATSSPVDEPPKAKMKKTIKTAVTNKTNNNKQSDTKKKQKLDKQEKIPDITTKSRKRKLSEAKETKQIEKKCPTDPQALLSNLDEMDLNKFLSTVHGPE